MLPTLIVLSLLQVHFSVSLSLQIGSVLPRLVKGVSSKIFGHGAYVDQKVHHTPRSFLNHEQWHQRHVLTSMNGSSVAYVTLSAPTGFLGTMSGSAFPSSASAHASYSGYASILSGLQNSSRPISLISASSFVSLSTYSSNATYAVPPLSLASATTLQAASLASLLGPTENLQMDKAANWDDQTELACSTALIALHGVATNPSGIAACYNIQSIDRSTGIFEIDLRLYRISAPTDGWLKLDSSSVGVSLTYTNATVSMTRAKKIKREDRTLPWFPAQRDEAADIYIRRSTGIPPRRLESMSFVGTVDDGALVELKNG